MRRKFTQALSCLFLASAAVLGFSQNATAQCTASFSGGTTSSSVLAYTGQTFTAGCTGNLTQVTIQLDAAKAYGITATIRNTCQGTVLGTASTAGNAISSTNTFTFSGLTLTNGSSYAIELARTGGGNIDGLLFSSSGTYAGGALYVPNCNFLSGNYDLNFTATIAAPTCVAPSFTSCPSNQTVNTSSSNCTAVATYTTTTTGTSPSLSYVLTGATFGSGSGSASGATFNRGTTNVALTATNACGNATCNFTVTVNDATPPLMSGCPANITTSSSNGNCGAVVSFTPPTATDNCPNCTVVPPNMPANASLIGTYMGHTYYTLNNYDTWPNHNAAATALGAHLVSINSAAENAFVSAALNNGAAFMGLNDVATEGTFVWTSGEPVTYTNWCAGEPNGGTNENYGLLTSNPGNCWADVGPFTYRPAIIEFDCLSSNVTPVLTAGIAPGGSFPVGTTTVTYTATDAASNVSTCSFTVTVTDNTAPSFSGCPANITVNAPANACSAAVTYTAPTASDNCSACGTPVSLPNATLLGTYNGHTYFAASNYNTWAAHNAYINGLGGHLVSITGPGEQGFLSGAIGNGGPWYIGFNDVAVEGSFVWTTGEPVSYTNWCGGEPNNGGPGGNEDHTLFTNNAGHCWVDADGSAQRMAIYEFDCIAGPVITPVRTAGPASGASFPVGVTTVTYTATDAASNSSTCTFTVTVRDVTAPVISGCPANMTVATTQNNCSSAVVNYTAPTATDNCGSASIMRTAGPASGSTFPLGTTTITYTATDGAGNTSTCSFTVTVSDGAAPVFTNCPSNITVAIDPSTCNKRVFYSPPVATDNCAPCPALAFMPANLTLIGNYNGHSYYLNADYKTWPDHNAYAQSIGGHLATITSAGENTYLGVNTPNALFIGANDAAVEGTFVWSNGEPFMYSNFCTGEPNGGVNENYVTLTSNAGNCWNDVSNGTFQQSIIEFECINSSSTGITFARTSGAGTGSGDYFPRGTTTVSYTATDASSNVSTCTFTVTVTDPTNACGNASRTLSGNGGPNSDFVVSASPNPFSDGLHLRYESGSFGQADVIVRDVTGRVLETRLGQQSGRDIVLGKGLASGVYIVEVRHGDASQKLRVVKVQ